MSKLVLASQSPRRRELLALLGIPFEVVYSNVNESPRPGEAPADFVARTARDKGTAVAKRISDAVILSADTIVSLDGGIFGKPRDTDDAVRMLQLLSGRQHSVLTAVSVIDSSSGERSEDIAETKVWFRELDREIIDEYVKREDLLDKAGAYAIQGFASVFIPRIEGNYPNVMGLPLPLTYDLLTHHGFTCRTSL